MTFRHKVNIPNPTVDMPMIYAWCEETLGKRGTVWERVGPYGYYRPGKFRFRFKKHATLFRLKWL